MPKAEREVFASLVRAGGANYFSEVDREAVNAYAYLVVRCREAEAALHLGGTVLPNGRASAWVTILRDTRRQLLALLPRLRATPSSRMQRTQASPAEGVSLEHALSLVARGNGKQQY